ncbi:MAG TPA: BTAD domain-containing putative transcriptional regulator, partial [Actinomycetes bacterium]
MSAFEFRLLGPVELRRGEHPVPLGSVRQRALLAVLLLSANEVVPTERLIDALWGPYPPLAARQSLHNHVSALRKLLGLGQAPAVLLTRDAGYLMEVEEERLDVARFRRLAERGSQSLAAGDPATATELLGAALALWRGPALADVVGMLGTGPAATAGELEEARAVATEQRIEAELALGHHREVTSELERLVSAEPLREHLHGQLMLALYRCGRQAEALATYRDARQRLVSELGVEPSVGLQRLEQAILAQDPALDLLLPAPPAEQPPGGDQAPGGAERKLVTVLLCDVDEPAEPARERDPEDVGSVLAEYLERVRAEVEDLGGQVEHVVGGLTMAAFGVPRTGEDDTERAVRAALAIRDALSPADRGAAARLQVGTHEPGSGLALDPPGRVRVRAAVATGEALVGQAPAAGITGDLVTVCGRLLHTAPPGAVLVSAATERLTARTIGYGSASLLALGGRAEPVPVWSALAPRSGDLLELAGTAAAPLAGREAELRALQRAYQEVRARRTPRLVLVTGPAGIGKSRLVAELGRRLAADPRPVTWRQGRCPHGSGAPWRALAEVVAARLDGLPPDEKAVLADAAVLGGAGSAAAVAALGGREPGWTRA